MHIPNEDQDSDVELNELKSRTSTSSTSTSTSSFDIESADPTTTSLPNNTPFHPSSSSSSSSRSTNQNANTDPSVSKSTLSRAEKKSIFLLYSIYLIHALPLTFSWATLPLLLRQRLNYTLMATFFISQYPYSIKILWSPIVQSTSLPVLGRRKSWLVPGFLLSAGVLFWLGVNQDRLIGATARGDEGGLFLLMGAWLVLMVLCSCIRIALDDWSLDLFSQGNVHWVSPTVTLAEISAGFWSFNLFLLASSWGNLDAGADGEEVSTKSYFLGMGVAFLVVAAVVLFLRQGSAGVSNTTAVSAGRVVKKARVGLRTSYRIIFRIIRLRHVWTLMLIHLTSMIGFMANDAIAVLQLSKNGKFTDRDIAGLATISLPLEMVSGILISRTFRKYHPLQVWRNLFPYRLGMALVTQGCVLLVTRYRDHHWRWFIALAPYLISKQFEDMMFISLVSFHAQIADPAYGGIYLPLLATTLNIRYDAMGFIITKIIGWIDGGEGMGVNIEQQQGVSQGEVKMIDGYQIVNICAVAIALPVFWFFLRPATMRLQKTERREWRVGDGLEGDGIGTKNGYIPVRVGQDLEADDDDMEVETHGRERRL